MPESANGAMLATRGNLFTYAIAAFRRVGVVLPMYAPAATRALSTFLRDRPDANVWEWGSGWSTIWFSQRSARTTSIEHDPDWWQLIHAQLERRARRHAECRYIPTLDPTRLAALRWDVDWPHFYVFDGPPGRPQFRDYISAIDPFPDESFDVVAIDGRERLGCLVHGASKVRRGGLLVLDDSDRDRYARAFDLLSAWHVERYSLLGHQTAIFTKPLG